MIKSAMFSFFLMVEMLSFVFVTLITWLKLPYNYKNAQQRKKVRLQLLHIIIKGAVTLNLFSLLCMIKWQL